MQYMNGHAPQIGDNIEVPSTGQRLTVTGIPQKGTIRCGNANLRPQGCLLLNRDGGQQAQGNGYYGQPQGTFGGVSYGDGYSGGYGQGYIDPGHELLEDILIVDAVVDLVEDIVDFGGGFGGDFF